MHPNTSINTIPIEKGKGGATRSYDATALKNYGEMYSQALDETGAAIQTLMDYKWVANAIEISLRKENVSFTVHKHIASLPPEKQADAIQKAEVEAWTTRGAKSKVQQISYGGKDPDPLPKDKYLVIYADPP